MITLISSLKYIHFLIIVIIIKNEVFTYSVFTLLALFLIVQDFFFMYQEGVCELQRGLSFNLALGVGEAWRLFFFTRVVINRDL